MLLVREAYVPFPRRCTTHGARVDLHFSLVPEEGISTQGHLATALPLGNRAGVAHGPRLEEDPLLPRRCPLRVVACLPPLRLAKDPAGEVVNDKLG